MTSSRSSRYSIVLDTVGPLRPDSLTRSALEQGLFVRRSRYNSRALIWRKLVGRDDFSDGICTLNFRALCLAKFISPFQDGRQECWSGVECRRARQPDNSTSPARMDGMLTEIDHLRLSCSWPGRQHRRPRGRSVEEGLPGGRCSEVLRGTQS